MKVKKLLLRVLGILCILYCIAVRFIGFGTRFFLCWSVIGCVLLFWSLLYGKKRLIERIPKTVRRIGTVLLCLGLIVALFVEGCIFSKFSAKPAPGAAYVLVLGAQWKRSGPSEVLRFRLDAAAKYLKENPDAIAIVSGGQGSNEPISEAEGMKQYLEMKGIDGSRIRMEDQSTNTYENMKFSAKLIEDKRKRVVVVTNNFHVFRALRLAKKQGYNAEGLSAGSHPGLLPNNLLRELLGVIKDFLVGNI